MVVSNVELDCPLCGRSEFKKRFTKKERHFFRCLGCDIELQSPLPTLQQLADFYEGSFADGMYQDFAAADELKKMTARQRIKEISKTIPLEGKWLDVGCANGVFVDTISKHGVNSQGVELSAHAVSIGRKQGLNLHVGMVDDLPAEETFDCITAFDVLEHVREPLDFIGSITKRLNPGGYAVFTVPNAGGIVRRIMGKRWYFYIPEEHLHYFNHKNLADLLRKQQLEVLNVGATYKPMTYDYALLQFEEFNPLIHKIMKLPSWILPTGLRNTPVPLPIGELRIIARKPLEVDSRDTSSERQAAVPSVMSAAGATH